MRAEIERQVAALGETRHFVLTLWPDGNVGRGRVASFFTVANKNNLDALIAQGNGLATSFFPTHPDGSIVVSGSFTRVAPASSILPGKHWGTRIHYELAMPYIERFERTSGTKEPRFSESWFSNYRAFQEAEGCPVVGAWRTIVRDVNALRAVELRACGASAIAWAEKEARRPASHHVSRAAEIAAAEERSRAIREDGEYDDWMLYGTDRGDAWIDSWCDDALALRGLFPAPMQQPQRTLL